MAVAKDKAQIASANKLHLVFDMGMGILGGLFVSMMSLVVAVPVGLGWGFAHYVADYNGWSVPILSWFGGFQVFALIVLGVALYNSQSGVRQALDDYRSYQHKGLSMYSRASGSMAWNVVKGICTAVFLLPILAGAIALAVDILINCLFGWEWSLFFSRWLTAAIAVWIISVPFVIHSYIYKDKRGSRKSIYAGYYNHHAHTPIVNPSASSSPTPSTASSPTKPTSTPSIGQKGTTYSNATDIWGKPVIRGSDGTTYSSGTGLWGNSVVRGSDGTTIEQGTNIWGEKVLRSNKGVTYTNTTDIWGKPVIEGSDGSKYESSKDLLGKDVLRKIK